MMFADSRRRVRTVLAIAGMKGNTCRETVVRALESIDGVVDVDVSLFRACAVIVHDPACEPRWLVQAVSGVGYQAMFGPPA